MDKKDNNASITLVLSTYSSAPPGKRRLPLVMLGACVLISGHSATALDLAPCAGAPAGDPSGVVQLRLLDPSLTASNVAIALANGWVNPSSSGQPASKFYYVNAGTVTQTAPGGYDGHASTVSAAMVGKGTGGNPLNWQNSMAPGIGAFYSYTDGDLINYNIMGVNPLAGGVRIVSQPFGLWGAAWGYTDLTNEKLYAQMYDNFAAAQNVLFVSSSGGASQSPASMFNGVCADSGTTPNGKTYDGRVYKHVYYPVGTSSAAAGSVGGGAAVLMQAAMREDGGPGTAADASDLRTLKALILNGATKDLGWTNSPTVPLDASQGAGMVNVYNSYTALHGGKLVPGAMSSLAGWDLRALTSSGADAVNSYTFSLSNNPMFPSISLASTIVWNRQDGQTNINHLTLELYDADTETVVPGGASLSMVDNLQMIYLPIIQAGNYQLRVKKLYGANQVSDGETYALAFSASGSYIFQNTQDQVWSNAISGSLPVIKSGAGVLTLTGSNSYYGGTLITSGTLRAGSANAIGSGKVSVGGVLDLAGQSISVESLSGSGEITSSGAGTMQVALNPTYTSPIPSFSGKISDGSGKVGLTAWGAAGNWGADLQILGGSNSFSGKTVISGLASLSVVSLNKVVGGGLFSSLGAPKTVEDGVIDIGGSGASAATLTYTGTGETTDRGINLTGAATLNQSGTSGLLQFAGDFRATGTGSKTLGLTGSTQATAEIAGAIVDGAGTTAVSKTGTGKWILSGTNTYSGNTTVSAGTLALVGGSQTSPITVSSNASLGFTLGSPSTSSRTVTFNAGSLVQITGTPTLESYTLMTASAISGTPALAAPIANYVLVVNGAALVLMRNPQTIIFPNPGTQDSTNVVTLTATASSGLPVSFMVESGPASLIGSTLTLRGDGLVTVIASQAGDTNWSAATPVKQTFMVTAGAVTNVFPVGNVSTTNQSPYREPFEGYIGGELVAGRNGWSASVYDALRVAEAAKVSPPISGYAGYFPIQTNHDRIAAVTGSLTNHIVGPAGTNTWVDLMLCMEWQANNEVFDTGNAPHYAFALGTNGQLNVYCYFQQGGTNGWLHFNHAPVPSMDWFRMSVQADYSAAHPSVPGRRWFQCYLNGRLLTNAVALTSPDAAGVEGGSWLPMAMTNAARLNFIGLKGDALLDDLVVDSAIPYGLAWTVHATASTNGSVFPAGDILVWNGSSVTVSVQPNAYYSIESLWVDGAKQAPASQFVFVDVTNNRSLSADFTEMLATNGTPHWWLASYGHTNDWDAWALGDDDQDKLLNWEEYVAGTDPTNRSSVLVVSNLLSAVSGRVVLSWPSVAARTYVVERATGLPGGFMPVTGQLPAEPPLNTYTDIVSGASCLFYRISVTH